MDNTPTAPLQRRFQGATRTWHSGLRQSPRSTSTGSPASCYTAAVREVQVSIRYKELGGEPDRIRTCDQLIKSQLLYQLSYGPNQFHREHSLVASRQARACSTGPECGQAHRDPEPVAVRTSCNAGIGGPQSRRQTEAPRRLSPGVAITLHSCASQLKRTLLYDLDGHGPKARKFDCQMVSPLNG